MHHPLRAFACAPLLLSLAAALDQPPPVAPAYQPGDSLTIECLNRTIDTGEHVTDPHTGALVYAPFATCNETARPLAIAFSRDAEIACTIADLPDEAYHLFEFYVHHDSPLACRIPRVPAARGARALAPTETDADDAAYVPLNLVLAGKLELSHLHIGTTLNLVVHIDEAGGAIDSAVAYSVSPLRSPARVMIGEPVPFVFRVRWYAGTELTTGALVKATGAGHTLLYCLLSAGVGAVGCYAWVVGVDVPRRLRRVTVGMRGRADAQGIIGNFGTAAKGGYAGYGGYAGNGAGSRSSSATPVGKGYGYGGKRKD